MQTSNVIDAAFQGFVNRSLNLWEDRQAINEDFSALHEEVRGAGYSVSLFRQVVKEQRMDPEAREAMLETLDDYRAKLGMLVGTPLGDAAEGARSAPRAPNGRGRGRGKGNSSGDAGAPESF